jgi:hypothetical protein
MPLLESTLLATLFLIPGFLSLALALSPRSRAIRQSSLGTRVFGLLSFAVLDWFLALLAYAYLPFEGTHCKDLATLLVGTEGAERAKILTAMLGLPAPVLGGAGLLMAIAVATGASCATLHHAALTGFAIRTFDLRPKGLKFRHQCWFYSAKFVEWALRFLRIADLFQPLGASHWLVLQKAAMLLQRSSAGGQDDVRVARVYVDVVQGDEVDDDGNVVFLLLTEAKRWSKGKASQIDAGFGRTASSGTDGRWKALDNSEALGLDGRNIRNVSFRLIERSPLTLTAWPEPRLRPAQR